MFCRDELQVRAALRRRGRGMSRLSGSYLKTSCLRANWWASQKVNAAPIAQPIIVSLAQCAPIICRERQIATPSAIAKGPSAGSIDFKIGLGVAWNWEDPTALRDDIIDIVRSLVRPGR
ncbi:hypothetical protein PMI11_03590 [Rhizobium sp. CF142]|nr:hypothetical protein PMI11_03590 [Rhizobium sp. CF142]